MTRLLQASGVRAARAAQRSAGAEEREADRVAEQVMQPPDIGSAEAPATVGAARPPGGERPGAGHAEAPPRHGAVRDQAEPAGSGHRAPRHRTGPDLIAVLQERPEGILEAAPGVPAPIDPSPESGRPLPAPVRAFFEPRLAQDLGRVRIHTGPRAAASAAAMNALAYTVGPDIVFAVGQYAPATRTGRRLLAHELTHVRQQSGGQPGPGPIVQRQDDPRAPGESPALQDHAPPGRAPTPAEEDEIRAPFPRLREFRILREREGHYNCFAWALGDDSRLITSDTIWQEGGYQPGLDGWTSYLRDRHGLGRFADGADESADVVLFGQQEDPIATPEHAARKADVPFGRLTFSSKLGGGYSKMPVIQHALRDLEGGGYGTVLRSFWRTPAPTPGAPAKP